VVPDEAPFGVPMDEVETLAGADSGMPDAELPPTGPVTRSAMADSTPPRGTQPQPDPEIECVVTLQPVRPIVAGALAAGLHGTLRVGSVPSALPPLLAPALARFKAEHARVAVAIEVATSDVMLLQLARGEVELMLGRLVEGHHDDEHEAVPVLDEPQVAVARVGHPLHAGQGVFGHGHATASGNTGRAPAPTLRDLARWPWVVQPPGSPQAGRFMAMMREAGVHRRIDIVETASTVATTALLEASDMLAVMPASLAAHYASLGVLRTLPVTLPLRVPDIQLVWRRSREFSAPAAAFRDAVLAQAEAARLADATSTSISVTATARVRATTSAAAADQAPAAALCRSARRRA